MKTLMKILLIIRDVIDVVSDSIGYLLKYKIIYKITGIFFTRKFKEAKQNHKYAILVAARNEETVIGNLVDSINKQDYPSELVTVFVVADNCTDNTAKIARELGAICYERFDPDHRTKGYALQFLVENIRRDYGIDSFEGYFIFDADNLLKEDYITCMNESFDAGQKIIKSYRNTNNFGDNWISAGYALWFLRESKYLNYSRMLLDTSSAISGTGFMLSNEIVKRSGGWKYYLLTEDIEFTVDHVINDYKIGFCKNAILYDEQPNELKQSIRQRMRWAKGYFQVMCNYGTKLIKGTIKGKNFSCYDMSMSILPALLLTIATVTINGTAIIAGLISGVSVAPIIEAMVRCLVGMYFTLYAIGTITTITEWKNIYTTTVKKILYTFTFPLFMMTYIPITLVALFKKVEWKPIVHSRAKSIADITKSN